jgi:hypothetical protein
MLSLDFPGRARNVPRKYSQIYFFDVHYIKIMVQLQICPIQQIPQARPFLPTLTIICISLPLIVVQMLPWLNMLHPFQLLHQLSCTKFLWLFTDLNLVIIILLFPPWMVMWKSTSMTNIAYFIPYSSRTRIFVTMHIGVVSSGNSTRQHDQSWIVMNTPD